MSNAFRKKSVSVSGVFPSDVADFMFRLVFFSYPINHGSVESAQWFEKNGQKSRRKGLPVTTSSDGKEKKEQSTGFSLMPLMEMGLRKEFNNRKDLIKSGKISN